jgi:hypothetical protein
MGHTNNERLDYNIIITIAIIVDVDCRSSFLCRETKEKVQLAGYAFFFKLKGWSQNVQQCYVCFPFLIA